MGSGRPVTACFFVGGRGEKEEEERRTRVCPLREARHVGRLEGVGAPLRVGEAEVGGSEVRGAEGDEEGLGGHGVSGFGGGLQSLAVV